MNRLSATLIATVLIGVLPVLGQSYSNPESVEYDASQDRYLVSNTGTGQILARDQAGNLSLFASLTGSGPHGLEIQGDTVFACNGGRVKGFDLASGAQVFDLNLGGSFLNGITSDGTFLYVTDFSAGEILKVDVGNQSFSTLVANTNGTPNGTVYDPVLDLLWVVFWGNNAPIKQYDKSTGAELMSIPTNLSNIDGVTLDCFGDIYVASWSPDQITRYAMGTTTPMAMPWSVSNPADIDFDEVNARICIPNTNLNTVTLESVANCATGVGSSESTDVFLVYPNPANDRITLGQASLNGSSYNIVDISGRSVLTGALSGQTINISDLSPGQYLLRFVDGPAIPFAKN